MFKRALTISALTSYAFAISGLSTQCTTALSGIATSPDAAACLAPNALISVFLGSTNTSLIPPINNWLTSLCGSPACSNDTLKAIVANATTGCSMELSALGFNAAESGAQEQINVAVTTYYPTVRKVVCLKDGDTNCITQTLTNFESIFGPLSIDNIVKVMSKGFDFNSIPKNMTCTNCIKEGYNVIKTDLPELQLGDNETQQALQGQCGADFIDGKTPAGISQSASTNTEVKQQSGSTSLASLTTASALVLISGLFAALL